MTLSDVVKDIENINEDLTIFQENREDINSNVILSHAEEGDEGIKMRNGTKYYYLIEIFLAKEFLKDRIQSLDYPPNEAEIVNRLYEYAIKDA